MDKLRIYTNRQRANIEAGLCGTCGAPSEGHPWCSDACKMKGFRRRKRAGLVGPAAKARFAVLDRADDLAAKAQEYERQARRYQEWARDARQRAYDLRMSVHQQALALGVKEAEAPAKPSKHLNAYWRALIDGVAKEAAVNDERGAQALERARRLAEREGGAPAWCEAELAFIERAIGGAA